MSTSDIVNIALGVITILGGWLMKIVWDKSEKAAKDIEELKEKHSKEIQTVNLAYSKEMQEKHLKALESIQRLEVLIAGDYVKRSDFDKTTDLLFKKLDEVLAKIDKMREDANK